VSNLKFGVGLLMAALACSPKTIAAAPPTATSPCSESEIMHGDWAGLSRYRDADGKVSTVDVVFMGDSITDLWTSPRSGGFFTGRNYLNRGIAGQTTPQMLLRFRQDVIALKPKAVVILAGTNDIAGNTGPMTNEEIEGNLASMSELAAAAHIKVILASITPVGFDENNERIGGRPMERIKSINYWIRSYAAANGYLYLDYFLAMVGPHGLIKETLTDDGLHPNARGYAVMGPLAETAIAAALR
jgi:lysophospholipase L1-like esterase